MFDVDFKQIFCIQFMIADLMQAAFFLNADSLLALGQNRIFPG